MTYVTYVPTPGHRTQEKGTGWGLGWVPQRIAAPLGWELLVGIDGTQCPPFLSPLPLSLAEGFLQNEAGVHTVRNGSSGLVALWGASPDGGGDLEKLRGTQNQRPSKEWDRDSLSLCSFLSRRALGFSLVHQILSCAVQGMGRWP